MSQTRIGGIQYARAIAALAVMLSHAVADVASHGGGFDPGMLVQTGAAGVDLFFVISGFVMVHSSAGLFGQPDARRAFLGRRLWRVVPLYWGTTAAFLLMQVARGNGHTIDTGHLAASLLFLPTANPSGAMLPTYGIGWTLNYEMFFYACFAAALGWPYRRGLALVAVALCGFVVGGALLDLPQPLRFWTHPLLLEFLLGVGIAVLFRRGLRVAPPVAAAAILVGLAGLAVTTLLGIGFTPDDPDRAMLRWLWWGVPCGLCFGGIVLNRTASATPHPLLGLLGDASYAVYLVHPMGIILMRPVFPYLKAALANDAAAASVAQVGLESALVIAGAIAVHRWLEAPLLRARRGKAPVGAEPAIWGRGPA